MDLRASIDRKLRWKGPLLAAGVALGAFGAACTEPELTPSAESALAEPSAFEPPVACGTTFPGPPLKSDLAEARPGYAEDLAAVDLGSVPDPVRYTDESKFVRSVVDWMTMQPSGALSHADAFALGGMGKAVLAAAAKGTEGRFDFSFLRRGLHHDYLCSRPLPRDLPSLKDRYGDYTTWPSRDIACSKPKNAPRRLFENEDEGVFIAETRIGENVRETEVLFDRLREDRQFDFAVYDAEGRLTDRSPFAVASGGTMIAPAPYMCLACHYDVETRTFTRRFPSGTGAGCP